MWMLVCAPPRYLWGGSDFVRLSTYAGYLHLFFTWHARFRTGSGRGRRANVPVGAHLTGDLGQWPGLARHGRPVLTDHQVDVAGLGAGPRLHRVARDRGG